MDRLNWRPIPDGEAEKIYPAIRQAFPNLDIHSETMGFQWSSVPFFKKTSLIRGTSRTMLTPFQVRALMNAGGVFVLSGSGRPIADASAHDSIHLTMDTIGTYAKFFCHALTGVAGPYALVERLDEIHFSGTPTAELTRMLMAHLHPLRVSAPSNELPEWRVAGVMVNQSALHEVELGILPDGQVHMVKDAPLADELPIHASPLLP